MTAGRFGSIPSRRGGAVHIVDAPAVAVKRLSATLGGRPALLDITFELEEGRQLAIVGPNGAGKTTLLRILAGLLSPSEGDVRIHGHGPCGHVCIAYVPQRSGIDWRFPVTVGDVVMMGRVQRIGPVRRAGVRDRHVVREALAAVDLADLAQRQIEELSGGQQQRMFIARALAQEAELILMDEPLAGLDIQSRDGVLGLLDELSRREVTVIVALHDLGIASVSFNRVLLLNRQQIGFGSASEVFTHENLQRAYGTCLRMVETPEGLMMVSDTACAGEGGDGHEHP